MAPKAALKAKSTAVVLGNGSVSNGTNGTKTTTTTTPEPRSAMKRAKSDGENSAESNKFEKKTRSVCPNDKKIIPGGLTTFSGHTRSGLHGNYQISPLRFMPH